MAAGWQGPSRSALQARGDDLCAHGLAQRDEPAHRPDHDGQLVDAAVGVGVDEVEALQFAIADPGAEDQRDPVAVGYLVDIAEVRERRGGEGADLSNDVAAFERLVRDRAVEHDLISEQFAYRVEVTSLDSLAEGVRCHAGRIYPFHTSGNALAEADRDHGLPGARAGFARVSSTGRKG